MPNQPLQVQSFDHITLIVSDLDATRKFYVDNLGMTASPRPTFDFPGAWFSLGSMQIHATLTSDLAGLPGWGERGVKAISRGHHFAFEIQSVSAAVAELTKRKIPIADGPKIRPDGAHQVYIYDPDGHLVELYSQRTPE